MNEKIAQNSVRGLVCPLKNQSKQPQNRSRELTGPEPTMQRSLRKVARFKRAVRRFKNSPIAAAVAGTIIILLLSLNLLAQTAVIIPLKIGQKVPAAIWQQKHAFIANKGALIDSVRLSDYKGKLILLDFWSTFCTNCIYSFPKLEVLQKEFGNDLQVILVNSFKGDTRESIVKMMSGNKKNIPATTLPTIYNDKILKSLFPAAFLPHYAWLTDTGELMALTDAVLINQETIAATLKYIAAEKLRIANLKTKPKP